MKTLAEIKTAVENSLNNGTAKLNFSEDYLRVVLNYAEDNTSKSLTVDFDACTSYENYLAPSIQKFSEYSKYYFKELSEPLFTIDEVGVCVDATGSELEDFCDDIRSTINYINPTILYFDDNTQGIDYKGCEEVLIENLG